MKIDRREPVALSVLTPNFNYARFLAPALQSVSTQSSSRLIEHVVWDGQSTDASVEVLRSFASEHELVWRSGPDSGQSDALNKAFALSSGEIIGWLNSDDAYLPGALEKVIAFFDEHPDVDVVYGDVAFVDASGAILRLLALYDVPPHVLRWRGCVLQSTASFFRRSVLGDKPWSPQFRTVMDWDLYLRIMGEGARFAYLCEPLAAFRVHADQVTHELTSRVTAEHQAIRTRYTAAPRLAAVARPVGDASHLTRKWIQGSKLRERKIARLKGWPLMEDDGSVNGATWGHLQSAFAQTRQF